MGGRGIALLRGINVGRAKRVAMADLRALFEALGYRDVRTVLNSGNVVYAAPETASSSVAARVEEALGARLGLSIRVTVLTAAQLATVVGENPLLDRADDPTCLRSQSRLQVAFLADPADRARLQSLMEQEWSPEALALGTRVAYLWCPDGLGKSPLHKAVSRLLSDGVTTRNWSTVLKLQALCASADLGRSQ